MREANWGDAVLERLLTALVISPISFLVLWYMLIDVVPMVLILSPLPRMKSRILSSYTRRPLCASSDSMAVHCPSTDQSVFFPPLGMGPDYFSTGVGEVGSASLTPSYRSPMLSSSSSSVIFRKCNISRCFRVKGVAPSLSFPLPASPPGGRGVLGLPSLEADLRRSAVLGWRDQAVRQCDLRTAKNSFRLYTHSRDDQVTESHAGKISPLGFRQLGYPIANNVFNLNMMLDFVFDRIFCGADSTGGCR